MKWRRNLDTDNRVGAVAWLIGLTWLSAAVWPITLCVAIGCLVAAGVRRMVRAGA